MRIFGRHGRHGRHGRYAAARSVGHRRPVLVYLIVLTLVPCLGLVGLAVTVTGERLAQSKAADTLARQMRDVGRVSNVYSNVLNETLVNGVALGASLYHQPAQQVATALGLTSPESVQQARQTTDRALAGPWSSDQMQQAADSLRALLTVTRQQWVGLRSGSGATAQAHANEFLETLASLLTRLQTLWERSTAAMETGSTFAAGAAVQRAATQVERIDAVMPVLQDIVAQINHVYASAPVAVDPAARPSPATTSGAKVDQLAASYYAYQVMMAKLEGQLSPSLQAEFARVQADPDVRTMLKVAAGIIHGEPGSTSPANAFPFFTATARAEKAHRQLLEAAVADGMKAARQTRSAAQTKALVAAGSAAAVVLLGLIILIFIGGRLRRSLLALAQSARQFSAGHLDTLEVGGTREIATAGAALNDATSVLQDLTTKVELLAAGDLRALQALDPIPGRLGQAIDVSVKRAATTMQELEDLQQQLRYQADHDSLTDLPNRASAERLLRQALTRHLASEDPSEGHVAVLFVDLDHFKECNDTFGHAAGDHALVESARRMRRLARSTDVVCRFGGDEFVIILRGVHGEPDVTAVAQRMAAALCEPIPWRDGDLRIGASIGMAIAGSTESAEQLLRHADSAVYQVKAGGRGGVQLHAHVPGQRNSSPPTPAVSADDHGLAVAFQDQ